MNDDIGPHPDWAIEQAEKLLFAITISDTREEKLDFMCLALRFAYHKGGSDTCDQLKARP